MFDLFFTSNVQTQHFRKYFWRIQRRNFVYRVVYTFWCLYRHFVENYKHLTCCYLFIKHFSKWLIVVDDDIITTHEMICSLKHVFSNKITGRSICIFGDVYIGCKINSDYSACLQPHARVCDAHVLFCGLCCPQQEIIQRMTDVIFRPQNVNAGKSDHIKINLCICPNPLFTWNHHHTRTFI